MELVAVMAILALVVAMAAPAIREFGRGRGGSDCASQILALCRWSRTQSVTEGAVYRLNFDAGSRSYWVTVQRYGVFEDPGQEFGRVFTAPESVVSVECTAAGGQEGQYIEFWPTGRTDPATIRITDNRGLITEVACQSPTELFQIVTSENQATGN